MQSTSAPTSDDALQSALSFEGVPLMQLAAIAAARAEGFSMEEALAVEGLEPSTYRAADVAYKTRLVDPAEREKLVADYQAELARAEDRLARKVSPLEDDVDAWVRFLGAYSAEPAPADWLAALGLSLPDLARLSRTWGRRFESDDSLRKRAEKAARDKRPYDVTSLRLSAPMLVPSPAARPALKKADSAQASPPVPQANPIPRWRPRSELLREEPASAVALDVPVKPIAAPAELMTTRPVFSVSSAPSLPFVPAPEVPEAPLPSADSATATTAREALSGTSLALDIPRGPATPFAASNAANKPAAPEKPLVKPAPAELSGTSLVVNIPRGPAMPFAASKEPEVISAKPVELEKPVVKRAPAELSGTSLAVDIPRGPATPFVQAKQDDKKPIEVLEEKPVAPDKPKVVRAPAELGGTSLAVEIPRGPATPFAAPEKPVEKKPVLSLEQHAALTVEIATYPAHAMAILARYGITPPQKVDLDQHYQRIVAGDPKARDAWHAAYAAHYTKLIRR